MKNNEITILFVFAVIILILIGVKYNTENGATLSRETNNSPVEKVTNDYTSNNVDRETGNNLVEPQIRIDGNYIVVLNYPEKESKVKNYDIKKFNELIFNTLITHEFSGNDVGLVAYFDTINKYGYAEKYRLRKKYNYNVDEAKKYKNAYYYNEASSIFPYYGVIEDRMVSPYHDDIISQSLLQAMQSSEWDELQKGKPNDSFAIAFLDATPADCKVSGFTKMNTSLFTEEKYRTSISEQFIKNWFTINGQIDYTLFHETFITARYLYDNLPNE